MTMRQHTAMNMNISTALHCCMLLDQLKRDLYCLQQEAMNLLQLEEDYNQKCGIFTKCIQEVEIMLKSLWTLAEELHSDNEIKFKLYEFVSNMIKSWRNSDELVAQDVSNVQLYSFTNPDLTLPNLLEQVQRNANSIMETFKTISGHFNCFGFSTHIYLKIIPVILRLSQGEVTYRYFLSLDSIIPFIKNLDIVIKSFTMNLIPGHFTPNTEYDDDYQLTSTFSQNTRQFNGEHQIEGSNKDLSAFNFVAKLLTGELLGHDRSIEPIAKSETPDIRNMMSPPIKPNLTTKISLYQCNPQELYYLVNSIEGMNESSMYVADECLRRGIYNNPIVWGSGICNTVQDQHEYYKPVSQVESTDVHYYGSPDWFIPNGNLIGQDRMYQYQRTNESWNSEQTKSSRDQSQLLPQSMKVTDEEYIPVYFENNNNNSLQAIPRSRRTFQPTKRRIILPKVNSVSRSPADEINDLQPIKLPRLQQNLFKPLL